MGHRESLAGVGLIVSHTGAAVWLKALYESYRVIVGCIVVSMGDVATEFLLSVCVEGVLIPTCITIPTMLQLPVHLNLAQLINT